MWPISMVWSSVKAKIEGENVIVTEKGWEEWDAERGGEEKEMFTIESEKDKDYKWRMRQSK